MPKAHIVVPVRGAHEALRLCLACLVAHTPGLAGDGDVDLRVVTAEAEFNAVSRIESETAGGGDRATAALIRHTAEPQSFARNCNLGARGACGAEFVVFLNSDAFVGPGWLDALLAPFADPDVVAVGPMGTNVSGNQNVGNEPMEEERTPRGVHEEIEAWRSVGALGHKYHREHNVPYRARRLVGFCLAVRRLAWDAVGGFDERFENAFCDDDLSLRLSLLGDCVVVPDLLVLHAGSASFAELPDAQENYRRTLEENAARFREKWERRGLLSFLGAWFDSRGVR